MDANKIKKVYVVYKTHLDVGFTDLAKNVLDKYVNDYIPRSIDMAEQLNTGENKVFVWTVGSFLIDYFFKNGSKEYCEKLKKAIKNGDICWHGLACTTHTEFLDEDLLDFDLSVSDKLDEQMGKKTIAAKMTDVPGHTRGLVSALRAHGKKYLHIGVNAASMVPEVPHTFVWKNGEDEVIVQYSSDYGTPCYVEGMEEALEFVHSKDNMGPQSLEEIQREFSRIQKKYPNAQVVASAMDPYAEKLWQMKDKLPVIEEEIGDTWIYGTATDPVKVMKYRALLRLKEQWKERGIFSVKDEAFEEFLMNLLLVAEHTWGLDYKKYLADFSNWKKEDLLKAREKDITTMENLTSRNAQLAEFLKEEMKNYRGGGTFQGSYAFFESSHEEQREYIEKAVAALPEALKEEAQKELNRLDVQRQEKYEAASWDGKKIYPYEKIQIQDWKVSFGGNGELCCLEKDGKDWLDGGSFGRLIYTIYNARDCMYDYYSYGRAFRENKCWSEPDFTKPGLEFEEGLKHRDYKFGVREMEVKENQVKIHLAGDEQAAEEFSCPREAVLTYTFGDKVKCSVSWQEKDLGKIPEALWLEMKFHTENPYRWKLKKLGQMISPFDVAEGGNRRLHCVEEVDYAGADGRVIVENIHSPLLSVGGHFLYGDYRELPVMEDGFAWCLYNNKWGTNFKMWCEDDCTFEYVIDVQTYPGQQKS